MSYLATTSGLEDLIFRPCRALHAEGILMRAQLMWLLVVTAFSGPAVLAQEKSEEAVAIQKLELLGGKIQRDMTLPNQPVVGVSFSLKNRFNDKYIRLLRPFEKLTTLGLLDVEMTDVGLQEIGHISTLTELELSGPEITDNGLKELEGLSRLTRLTLCGTRVTPDGLKGLKTAIPRVSVSDESAMIKRLEGLGATVHKFQGGHRMKGPSIHISFSGSELAEPVVVLGLFAFQSKSAESKVTDEIVMELKRLRGVATQMDVGFTGCRQITDAGIRELATIANLGSLYIRDCPAITCEALKPFRDHQNLTSLHLQCGEKVSDDDLKIIGQIKSLEYLDLYGCSRLTDTGIAELSQLTKLDSLDLTQTQVSGPGLRALRDLHNLTTLTLQSCRHIADEDMKQLGQLTKLKRLRLSGTEITDVGMQEFQNLQDLVFLDICNSKFTDAGLRGLGALRKLKTLQMQNCHLVTDAGMDELKELSSLEDLTIAVCPVTDAGLMKLKEMQSLRTLYTSGCQVTRAGCVELKKSLPQLTITR